MAAAEKIWPTASTLRVQLSSIVHDSSVYTFLGVLSDRRIVSLYQQEVAIFFEMSALDGIVIVLHNYDEHAVYFSPVFQVWCHHSAYAWENDGTLLDTMCCGFSCPQACEKVGYRGSRRFLIR